MVSVAAQLIILGLVLLIQSFPQTCDFNTCQSKRSAEIIYIKAYQDCSVHADPIMLADVLKLNIFNVFKFTAAHAESQMRCNW